MEPFDLTLQQVNFEESELPSPDLDSFGTIVNYNYHFTSPQVEVSSLASNNTAESASKNSSSLDSFYASTPTRRPRQGRRGVTRVTKAITSPVTCPTVSPSGYHSSKSRRQTTSHSQILKNSLDVGYLRQVSANTDSAKSYLTHYSMPVEEMEKSPGPQSHLAPQSPEAPAPEGASPNSTPFETVAEALHLQWSVIGDKTIKPASPEVVAQVIAEAEKRIKLGQGVPVSPNVPGDSMNVGAEKLDDTHNMEVSSTMTTSDLSSLSQELSLSETTETRPDVQSVSPSMPEPRELIRISAESITRTKEKSSWFSGGSSKLSQSSTPSPTIKKQRMVESEGVSAPRRDSDIPSVNSSSQQSIDDQANISDTSSDVGISEKNMDADVFLKSLPPLQPLDMSEFSRSGQRYRSHSPPVRETSFKPSYYQEAWKPGEIQSASIMQMESTQSTSDILESLLGENYRNPFSKNYVVPALGPLFQKSTRESTTISSVHHVSSSSISSLPGLGSEEVDNILHEKAKLEGQLEMLTQEAEVVMQERAELQAQVASLRLKLKSQADKISFSERDGLMGEVNSLRQSRSLIETALLEIQKLLEEKTEEARALQEELQATQETTDKLHSKMKELRDELKVKEVTIQALKNKVAELYVEVQTALQAKMTSDNEARSAKNDVATLINAKEWYQQQLQLAHEARSDLQKQLTLLQANTISHGKVIERLKTENARLRQQFTQVQNRALKEKESLARHLETIESDMLDREAAFQEISRERSMMENTLQNKMYSVEAETSKMTELFGTVTDLEVQLEKAQHDLKRRLAHIAILESDQSELMKRLNLSLEAISERDKTIEDVEQKLIEVEARLKAFQDDVGVKNRDILKLREEKASTEIALKAALVEKQTVDTALQTLKGDMGKVEKSFRQMKHDLSSRSTELQLAQDQKRKIQEELEGMSTQFRQQQLNIESAGRNIHDKGQLVMDLQRAKRDLEEKVEAMKCELETLRTRESLAVEDEEKVALRQELVSVRQALAEVEHHLHIVQEQRLQSAAEATKTSLPVLSSTEITQTSHLIPQPDEALLAENDELKQRLKEMQSRSQKDLLKQKARATKLNVDMTKLQSELTERQEIFESNVEQLSLKLRETMTDKDRLETELEMLHRKFDLTMVEQKDQLHSELQSLATELETTKLRKQELESALYELKRIKDQEIEGYCQQLSALEEQLVQERELKVESTKTDELNHKLSLELEKERGRVAGLLQSQSSLKQHVSTLEEALARRESSLVELHNHMQESVTEKEKAEHEYIKRIQMLEEGLQNERDNHRDVRKKIGQKITENKRVRRQYDGLKTEHDQVLQDCEQKQQQLRHIEAEYERIRQGELALRTQLERVQSERTTLQSELERLERHMKDSETNNPVFAKQLETLEWQLKQKDSEILSLQDQLNLSENRQQVELENLTKALQSSKIEAEILRKELVSSKKKKYDLQSKMAELRGALKAAIQHHKLRKKLRRSISHTNGQDSGDGQVENGTDIGETDEFDVEMYEKLLDETSAKALNSKPLDDLHSCLSSLRYQISGLQRQVEEHTVTVHTSSQSWRIVEDGVKELREVVRTVCGTNTNATTTTVTTQVSVEEEEGTPEKTTPLSPPGSPGLIDI